MATLTLEPLFTLEEVAAALGVHVKTARRQALAGRWNACRIGGRIRIPESVVRALTTPRALGPRRRAAAP